MPKKGFQAYPFNGSRLDFAIECIQRGFQIVPIPHGQKHASGVFDVVDGDGVVTQQKWGYFKEHPITEEQAPQYWSDDPAKKDGHGMALITGEASGVMVLDADKPEAVEYLKKHGLESPLAASTRTSKPIVGRVCPSLDSKGNDKPEEPWRRHHWFAYDPAVKKDIGQTIPGLDVLTQGALVMMYPSPDYDFEVASGAGVDLDNLPTFKGFPQARADENLNEDCSNMDLSGTQAAGDSDDDGGYASFLADIDKAKAASPTGKLQEGNRNHTVARFTGHCLRQGFIDEALTARVDKFMDKHFDAPLGDEERDSVIRSIRAKDAARNPGRAERAFAERIAAKSEAAAEAQKETEAKTLAQKAADHAKGFVTYEMGDIEQLAADADEVKYFMEPWIREGAIVQLFGYSGHGKSLVMQNVAVAMAAGAKRFGPFKINHQAKILYLDYENGKAMISERLADMKRMHGDTGKNLQVWTPDGKASFSLNLSDEVQCASLETVLDDRNPDIVIIDTVRSAFPGMEENDKNAWNAVNGLAVRQSLKGKTVIMLHHANKPTDSGLGRASGSSHMSTHLTRQLSVTQVFKDEQRAKRMAGIWEEKFYGKDRSMCDLMDREVPPAYTVKLVVEMSTFKARDRMECDDDQQWLAFAGSRIEEAPDIIVSSTSTRQRAVDMAMDGFTEYEISERLDRKPSVIRRWLGIDE